jgi:phage terminase large subunit-like protein
VFADTIIKKYEGTRKGKQELLGEILDDVEGALWTQQMIQDALTLHLPERFDRIVVAVDPAGTSKERSDETGIVVLGRYEDLVYVLADHSGKYTPDGWAQKVATVYDLFSADVVVAENNYGGEMVTSTLRNARKFMRIQEVNSRRGKLIRAEPVVALYEQHRIKHAGELTVLEDQLLSWIPGKGSSPDRLDALVHGVHALVRTERPVAMARPRPVPMRQAVRSNDRALRLMGNFR